MSLAEEMLATMSASDDISTYLAEEEPHIVINASRQAIVPNELKTIAVTGDKDIETVTFDCVRYWDGNDLSTFAIYLNYVLPDGTDSTYIPKAITTSDGEDVFHFDWEIKNNITRKSGKISFAVTAVKTKENENGETVVDKQWNSLPNGDCSIALGLDISNVPTEEESTDVVAQLSAILERIHGDVDEWIKTVLVQTTGNNTAKAMSQDAVTKELNKKIDKTSISQSTGTSDVIVMSQNAVTHELTIKEASILTKQIETNDGVNRISCDFKKGNRYRVIVDANSNRRKQIGVVSSKNPSEYIISCPITTDAYVNFAWNFVMPDDGDLLIVYLESQTPVSVSVEVKEIETVRDGLGDYETNKFAETRNCKDGVNLFEYHFVKGKRYKTVVNANLTSRKQIGVVSRGNTGVYLISCPITTEPYSDFTWEFVTPEDGGYFVLYVESPKNPECSVSIVELETQKEFVENRISEVLKQNRLKPKMIYKFNGVADDKIVCPNWIQNANNIQLNHTGSWFADAMKIDVYSTAYNRVLTYDFMPKSTNSNVCAFTTGKGIENFHGQGSRVAVDFNIGQLQVYSAYGVGDTSTTIPTTLGTKLKYVEFAVNSYVGRLFRLIIKRGESRNIDATLIDLTDYSVLAHIQTDYERAIVPSYGLLYDVPAFTALDGNVQLHSATVTINEAENCHLYIIGDSITEGVPVLPKDAWAYKVASVIPNTIVSGRGGGNILGVLEKLDTEASVLKPKYIMVTIGTNGGNTVDRLQSVIAKIKEFGAIPIINTVSTSTSVNYLNINNTILALNEKCVRMDVATSLNYNIDSGCDSTLFVDDGVHPNETGHDRMFKRVLIDLPELFCAIDA